MNKPWYRSKTIWCNAIAAALVATEGQLHLLEQVLPFNVYVAVAVTLPALNMALRAVTKQGISLRREGRG